jgi:hypothetical protein
MTKPYDKRIPALLQSKTSLTDVVSVSVKREFVEGYVLSKKLRDFAINSPMLVSANQPEQAEDVYVKVRVIVDADQSSS